VSSNTSKPILRPLSASFSQGDRPDLRKHLLCRRHSVTLWLGELQWLSRAWTIATRGLHKEIPVLIP
jgi:hypothetical protein